MLHCYNSGCRPTEREKINQLWSTGAADFAGGVPASVLFPLLCSIIDDDDSAHTLVAETFFFCARPFVGLAPDKLVLSTAPPVIDRNNLPSSKLHLMSSSRRRAHAGGFILKPVSASPRCSERRRELCRAWGLLRSGHFQCNDGKVGSSPYTATLEAYSALGTCTRPPQKYPTSKAAPMHSASDGVGPRGAQRVIDEPTGTGRGCLMSLRE